MAVELTIPFRFIPRHYQIPVFSAFDNGIKRFLVVWHRRAGKDLSAIHFCVKAMLLRPGTYWHVLPTYKQGRKIVWQGMDKKGRPFLDAFPKQLMAGPPNEVDMRMQLMCPPDPETGEPRHSIYQIVGGDNYNDLVGTNPVGIIFSEWSLTDPNAWEYMRPIIRENGGWVMFIYTPRGKNHAYKLHMRVRNNKSWFVSWLNFIDTEAVSPEEIEEEYKEGMSVEKINQEYNVSYEGGVDGAIYAEEMRTAKREGRIVQIPYNARLPVMTAWDIGVKDDTTIWFIQKEGNFYNVIDFYDNHNLGLDHYAKVVLNKPYVYSNHFGPWDLKQVIQGKKVGTRLKWLRELGIAIEVVKKIPKKGDSIDLLRPLLHKMRFDTTKASRVIAGMNAYRRDYDELTESSGDIVHDYASHVADAGQVFAAALDMGLDKKEENNFRRINPIINKEYDPFN